MRAGREPLLDAKASSVATWIRDLIGRKVEIATAADRMRSRIRRRVEADAIEVF